MTQSLRDIKVTKTKELLRNTLLDLIEEKGFDAITVRDITLKAGLNRGTFYLHYRDKYDLMEINQNEIMNGLQERLIHVKPNEFDEFYSKDLIYPPILKVFQYLNENRRLIKVLLSTKGDPAFPKRMKEFIKITIHGKLVEIIEKDYLIDVPHEYTTAFLSSAFFGIVEEWIQKEDSQSPEEMAIVHMKMVKLIKRFMTQIVK